MKKLYVKGQQEVRTFVYMHTGAKHMLELAKAEEVGSMYTLISSLIFSAFTMEAYLNHLGKSRVKEWDKVERNYPKLRKLKMFCRCANLTVDQKARPYKTIIELFQFRDQMAHGKTIIDEISFEFDKVKDFSLRPITENRWQSLVKVERADEAVCDVEQLIKVLHSRLGSPGDPFDSSGGGTYIFSKTIG